MNYRQIKGLLIILLIVSLPRTCPAPFIYTPGQGWRYETPSQSGKWIRDRAKAQLEVAQAAFDEKDYKTAAKAARYTIRQWPFSDYSPTAQYLIGRSFEERGKDEQAFKAYQELIEKYPKAEQYDEVLNRQFEITNRYLDGKKFRLWGYIPLFSSMDKTSDMYAKVIKNGPYSEVAPQAQLNIGAAREKQKDFPSAVKAYEQAADKYHSQQKVAADALYKAGMALKKEASTAEYDQHIANQAIETFTDFIALYPEDERSDTAQNHIKELRVEQARGGMMIARYYDSRKKYAGALAYYNEVVEIFSRLLNEPDHPYAVEARERIEALKQLTSTPEPLAQK